MKKLLAPVLAWLALAATALAQQNPSGYPLASLPLTGIDAVAVDQCASLGPPPVACVTKQAPSIRFGQPIVSPFQPATPFLFQAWWNTGISPAQYSVWNGSAFVPVYQVDQSTGIPSFPGNVYLPNGFLSISNIGGPLSQFVPNWPVTLFINNTPSTFEGYMVNTYENGTGVVGASYRGFAARGPYSSPAAIQSGDVLSGLTAGGFWSGKPNPYYIPGDGRGGINVVAAENWVGVNNNGTSITFNTTQVSTNLDREIARFDGFGNFGLGTTTPASGFTLTQNNVAALAPMGYTANTYENGTGLVGNAFRGFSTRGTAASPTNLIASDPIAQLQGGGFWTGKSASVFGVGDQRAQVGLFAGETWVGPSNNGTYVSISTTANGTGSIAERVRFLGSGGVAIGSTADPGSGGVVLTGALAAGFSVMPVVEAGGVALPNITPAGTAPGAGAVKLVATAGTTPGTCKIVAYAGTSTTPTTLLDNIGGGC